MKKLFCTHKKLLLQVLVAVVLSTSLIIIGGEFISAQSSTLPSLESLKSYNKGNKLSAEMWNHVIDHLSGVETDLISVTNDVSLIKNALNSTGVDVVGVDESYVNNKITELNNSLTQRANNTFLTGVFIPKVTYYRGVFDLAASLGSQFSKTCTTPSNANTPYALTLYDYTSSSYGIAVDYCGTVAKRWRWENSPRGTRRGTENVDKYTAVFSNTLLSNHDVCTLAGVGGALNGGGEFIEILKKPNGKIDLWLHHETGGGLDFTIACVDFSPKAASSTFSVTTQGSGYLRSTCGHTPGCNAGYYAVAGGETGDGCGFLKKERATVCVKQTESSRSVGSTCIASIASNGSLTSGNIGFKITKGKVDQYGRCISNGSTATSTMLNARIDNNRDRDQSLGTLSV